MEKTWRWRRHGGGEDIEGKKDKRGRGEEGGDGKRENVLRGRGRS